MSGAFARKRWKTTTSDRACGKMTCDQMPVAERDGSHGAAGKSPLKEIDSSTPTASTSGWGGRIKERNTGGVVWLKRSNTADAAKLAAFDEMIVLKNARAVTPRAEAVPSVPVETG